MRKSTTAVTTGLAQRYKMKRCHLFSRSFCSAIAKFLLIKYNDVLRNRVNANHSIGMLEILHPHSCIEIISIITNPKSNDINRSGTNFRAFTVGFCNLRLFLNHCFGSVSAPSWVEKLSVLIVLV